MSIINQKRNKNKITVTFDDTNIQIINDPPHLSVELANYRKSDWAERYLDKIRRENLLNPIIEKHVRKVKEELTKQESN